MNLYFYKTIFSFIVFLLLLSCQKNENIEVQSPFLKLETNSINFTEKQNQQKITIKSNGTYTVNILSGKEWCGAEIQSDGLLITVGSNPDKNIRRAEIDIILGPLKETVKVAQLGWGKAILLSSDNIRVNTAGGEFKVDVTTNIDFKYQLESTDWIKESAVSRSDEHPVVTGKCSFFVEPNKGNSRTASIIFTDTDEVSDIEPVTLTVTQSGLDDYNPVKPEDIKDDIPVKIKGGWASSFHPGEEIEKSFDGNKNTMYSSSWDNSGENYFPITLEYYFEDNTSIDYFIYYPRLSGSNGLFKIVDIEVKSCANNRGAYEWKKVMTFDFKGSNSATRVDFPSPLIGISAVRMIVKSGAGDGRGFATCSEMEFYKKNPENFDWKVLFTDKTCTELKAGITEKEILECNYSFFQNIAYYMYNDKYPEEFRIAEFKAYPHPDSQAKINKTNTYSLLDNPTGISVEKDEYLVVLSDLKDQRVSLLVQNLDKPGGDGFGGDTYPLTSGVNKIKMHNRGLVYVMYHDSDYSSLPKVKLHIATGSVNGYYDSENPALNNRAQELLNKATDKYFDVLGKYAHLTFPTSRFRNHTKDLKKLIGFYDDIVYNEQMLMGLVRCNRMFVNRMYFNVMYHSYMYSTSYRTGYNDGTLSDICDDSRFKDVVWGPAHEVGHSNQTSPGLKWVGTTEVTNNIMSEYIQTTIFNADSRLQVEYMGNKVASNRYATAWNGIVVDKLPHALHGDVFCKLVPFWQLELYMGKVKGETPLQKEDKGGFYPDVYEYIRTNPDKPNAGEQQLEFVYIASKCAKLNLLDFFEKWGFLREIDRDIEDYWTERLTVTKSQIEDIKRRVNALGYEKPVEPIEYISDNNYRIFKEEKAVIPGIAQINGNVLTMTNWKNVIAYEIRDKSVEGKLIAVSEGINVPSNIASFEVRGGWKESYKVYAVQYDNKRIEVKLN